MLTVLQAHPKLGMEAFKIPIHRDDPDRQDGEGAFSPLQISIMNQASCNTIECACDLSPGALLWRGPCGRQPLHSACSD